MLRQCTTFKRLNLYGSANMITVSCLKIRRVNDMGMNQFTAVSCLIRDLSHQHDGSSSFWPRLEVSAIMQSCAIVSRQWDGAPGHERPLRADRRMPELPQETPHSLRGRILLKVTGEEKAV